MSFRATAVRPPVEPAPVTSSAAVEMQTGHIVESSLTSRAGEEPPQNVGRYKTESHWGRDLAKWGPAMLRPYEGQSFAYADLAIDANDGASSALGPQLAGTGTPSMRR